MSVSLGANIAALRSIRQLAESSDLVARTQERLSSGMRINRASDDAAGLAIASSLNASSRVYGQGIRNINDGISALNVVDGALGSLSDVVTRLKELSEQAANGTFSLTQRRSLDGEADQLVNEYNRIISTAQFNGVKLLDRSTTAFRIQGGYGLGESLRIGVTEGLSRNVSNGSYQRTANAATNAIGIDTADFNGDGKLDLVTSTNTGGTVNIFLGDGTGGFSTTAISTTVPSGGTYGDLRVGDFNKDGKADVAVARAGSGGFSLLLGDGAGGFSSISNVAGGGPEGEISLGDFNGDGNLDVYAGGVSNSQIFYGDGAGSFSSPISLATPGTNSSVGDFNGDGVDDLVFTNSTFGTINIYLGGRSGLTQSASLAFAGARGIGIADFNGDGKKDLVVSSTSSTNAQVYLGDGTGQFTLGSLFQLNAAGTARDIAVADLNGDGYADILSASSASSTITYAYGNGDGTFAGFQSVTSGLTSSQIAVGDFNGDGVIDFAGGHGSAGISSFISGTNKSTSLQAISLNTREDALSTLDMLSQLATRISNERGLIGSSQSRLNTMLDSLQTRKDNYLAAEGRITNADIAQEAAQSIRAAILQQVGASVLGQANLAPQLALLLLGR